MLRRGGNVSCFFCLSAVSSAHIDPRSFRCPHCGCWNRFNAGGEILSDDPAMHDENLNARSFAKRGPSLLSFPTSSYPHSIQHPRTRTDYRPPTAKAHSVTLAKPTRCSSSTSFPTICPTLRQVHSYPGYIHIHSITASRLRPAPRKPSRLS